MSETRKKSSAPQPKGSEGKKCSIEGCKRAYQAKGYCFFHYDKWKNGELRLAVGECDVFRSQRSLIRRWLRIARQ